MVSVILGAFGAHALSGYLSERALAIYHTACQYEMYHALALIGLGLWAANHGSSLVSFSGWSFALGSLIFCGSLFALVFTDVKILGAITPIGGVLFIAGWAAFSASIWRSR